MRKPLLKKILLVEDDSYDAELTIEALKSLNLINEIMLCHDGEDLLDYLYKRGRYSGNEDPKPAVVLLDLKMPKVDGLQVLEQIKSDKKLKAIPVVVLTSSREETDLERCYELGVNAYVVKPVNIKDFMNAVKELGVFWALLNEPPSEL